MAPNWNGYQAVPDPANPGQVKLVLVTPNYLTPEEPFLQGPPRMGCTYDGSYDGFVEMSMTTQNGGNDMTNASYSPLLNMRYIGVSYIPAGHPLSQGGNGLRHDRRLPERRARRARQLDRQHRLEEADDARPVAPEQSARDGDEPAVPYADGRIASARSTRRPGRSCGASRRAHRSQAGTISYMVNGVQYVAMTNMAGSQPYSQGGNGDAIFVFKLGGTALYTTGPHSNPVVVSGSQEAPSALPIPNIRRPVDNTAAGNVPATEVWLARSNGTATSTPDSTATSSMVPSTRTVAVGTTVTFRNPGTETFPTSPNTLEHCATQFFEGAFNFRLQPGQTAQYTFNRAGEYFYNDCTNPMPTGKVVVTLTPQVLTGALQVLPSVLNLRSPNGIFTGVNGVFTTVLKVPAGYTLDSPSAVTLKTPLTTQLFTATTVAASADGTSVVATFNKGDIDNNVPAGDAVPLTLTANFINGGVQTQLQSTANVRVLK